MKNNTPILDSLDDLKTLQWDIYEGEIYFSEDIIKNWEVWSVSDAYKIFLQRALNGKNVGNYSVRQVYVDGRRYFHVESRDFIAEDEQKIVMDLLNENFWDSLISVGVFGSYITKEDWGYSDFDLVVVLEWYKDSDIYEREKASPRIKRKLKELWVKSLFAFNFTTKQELESAHQNNPWLLETMWKSFYTITDQENFLERILTQDRWIKYLWSFMWEWVSLNNNSNLDNIDRVLLEYRGILDIAKKIILVSLKSIILGKLRR